MKVRLTARAQKDQDRLPTALRARLERQLANLLRDLRHPSLQAKKYDETRDIWQGRVTGSWRFYFCIVGDTYVILSILPRPK